jgi:hypothetical protein
VVAGGTDINVGGGGGDSPPADWSPLKCGTYLIEHPLMMVYFARSIIVILDHTEEGPRGASKTEEGGGINEGGVGGFGGGGGGSGGGKYGLIMNRLALQPELADPAWRQLDLLRRNLEEKRSRRLEEEDGDSGGWGGRGDGNDDAYGSSVLLRSDSLPTGGGVTSAALSSSTSLQDGTLWLSVQCALGEGEADSDCSFLGLYVLKYYLSTLNHHFVKINLPDLLINHLSSDLIDFIISIVSSP